MKRLAQLAFKTIRRLIFQFDEFTCTIPISKRLDFVVYERPGIWCNDLELSNLVEDMRVVAKYGQEGREIPWYGPLTGDRKDLSSRIISIAYDRHENRAVGFSAQSYLHVREGAFSTEVVHLGLIYVDPNYQGKSVSYLLSLLPNVLILIKSGFRDIWISSVSQIPAVVGLVAANYSNVYPSHDAKSRQTFMHKKLGNLIMDQHRSVFGVGYDADYDSERQVIKNAYTGGSDNMKKQFDETTKHRSPEVNELCRTHLDYQRGDDFLQIGQLKFRVVCELFKNKAQNLNNAQIFINLLIIAAAMVAIPLLRWLIPMNSISEVRVRAQGIKNV
jgi:hypothetical protein